MRALLYATRSVIPSAKANAVQSANMIHAFDRAVDGFAAIFRSELEPARASDAFASYGLPPPRQPLVVRARPTLDWTQLHLMAYHHLFQTTLPGAQVYTRSARAAATALLAGRTAVLELHDPLTPPLRLWLTRALRTGGIRKLVATTQQLRDDLLTRLPLSAAQVLVAGGAANRVVADQPPITPTPGPTWHVGYAGSAYRGKGLEIVQACAARLHDVAFHVIGPSAEDCRRHGQPTSNLHIHGRRGNAETVRMLKGMDCLLLPNQRSVIIGSGADIGAHTSPLKMFEYLATGRPVVASDLPVLRCALRDADNALLVPSDDAEAFCRAIMRLRENAGLAARLGAQGRADFLTLHTWEARATRILDFIDS